MKIKTITIADLFCGAGGTSTGAVEAIEMLGHRAELTAVNHWDRAIATHKLNHPEATHLLTAIDNVNPKEHFREGGLDILWASPECTHHSVARGGRPINDQSRATAWCVVRWAGDLRPDVILVENVPEFMTWGGIGTNGRPLKNKKGQTYLAWKAAIESLGYRGDQKILRAADFGDPTTRQRLFVQFVRGKRKIVWPQPTHAKPIALTVDPDEVDMFDRKLRPWATARDSVIDWSLEGRSIYDRKRPLSDKTMRRILTGLQKFGLKPFIVPQHTGPTRTASVDSPLGAVTTTSRGVGMCEPMVLSAGGPDCPATPVSEPIGTILTRDHRAIATPIIVGVGGPEGSAKPQSVESPLGTVLTDDRRALAQPYLVNMKGESNAADIDNPAPTVTAHAPHLGVADPILVKMRGSSDSQLDGSAQSIDQPVPAVCGVNKYALAQFVLPHAGKNMHWDNSPRSVDEPIGTVTASHGGGALCDAFLVPNFGEREGQEPRTHSIDEPLPAVTSHGAGAIAQPYLVNLEHSGANSSQTRSIDEPLATISTKASHAVAEPYLVHLAHGESKGEKNPENRRVKPITEPLGTIHAGGKNIGICEPRLRKTEDRARSINEPMPTICGNRGDMAICSPALLPQHGGGALRPVDQPAPTVTTDGAIGLVQFVVPFYGTGVAYGVDEPLHAVTTKDRHALVEVTGTLIREGDRYYVVTDNERYLVDIRFRMLQPHELAAAQGFRKDYKFAGNKTDQVKLIGNAVPRRLARALVLAAITQQSDISHFLEAEEAAAA